MKIGFIDDDKNVYHFSLRKTEDSSLLYISKRQIMTDGCCLTISGSIVVLNDQIQWNISSAYQWVALEARQFIDKVIKLKAFL